MKRYGKFAAVLAAAVGVGAVVGAESKPTTGESVLAIAQPATKKYVAAVAAADAERGRAVDRARVDMVVELKAAQKVALERNDLDGAMACAELAKRYGSAAFDGDWSCSFPAYFWGKKAARVLHVGNGRIWMEAGGLKGSPVTLRVADGVAVADFAPEKVNIEREVIRFTPIAGGRLLVEIFGNPSGHRLRDVPDQTGVAVR